MKPAPCVFCLPPGISKVEKLTQIHRFYANPLCWQVDGKRKKRGNSRQPNRNMTAWRSTYLSKWTPAFRSLCLGWFHSAYLYHRGKKYRAGTRALLRYFRIRAPSSGVEVRNVNKRTCQYPETVKYHNKYVSANNAFIDRIK